MGNISSFLFCHHLAVWGRAIAESNTNQQVKNASWLLKATNKRQTWIAVSRRKSLIIEYLKGFAAGVFTWYECISGNLPILNLV